MLNQTTKILLHQLAVKLAKGTPPTVKRSDLLADVLLALPSSMHRDFRASFQDHIAELIQDGRLIDRGNGILEVVG
jgi:hypothetical protein